MCTSGNHVAGYISGKEVRINVWDKQIQSFEARDKSFKARGQNESMDHPGHVTRFNYCPECGANMAGIPLRGLG